MDNEKSNHPHILQYLEELSNGLSHLPNTERNHYVLEIEDHLHSLVHDKMERGHTEEQAVQETLNEMLTSDKLAEQMISQTELSNVASRDRIPSLSSKTKTNAKSLISFVLGIISVPLSIFGLISIPFAIVGILFGVLGLKEMNKTDQSGRGIAISGLICSSFTILISVTIFIVMYF